MFLLGVEEAVLGMERWNTEWNGKMSELECTVSTLTGVNL